MRRSSEVEAGLDYWGGHPDGGDDVRDQIVLHEGSGSQRGNWRERRESSGTIDD